MINRGIIIDTITTLKSNMGIYSEYKIVNESQANEMGVGSKLLEEGGMGAHYERGIIYVLHEKMTSPEKCVFAVGQNLCRKDIVPKSGRVEIILETTIRNDYANLNKKNKSFRESLYGLVSTSWILFVSTIPSNMKSDYIKFVKKVFDPTNLEGINNLEGRKVKNAWELMFRLQNLLVEVYEGKSPTESSISILDRGDKKTLNDLGDIIIGMANSFWKDYRDLLKMFNTIYTRFSATGHGNDSKEIDKEKQTSVDITNLDAEVFYNRCKKQGLSDNAIKDYFTRIKKLDKVEIVGVSESNNTLQALIGAEKAGS